MALPARDADLALTPAGEHSSRLSLAGAYRPPLGAVGAGLDKAIFHKVAHATVRSLLARGADALTCPPGRRAGSWHNSARAAAGGTRSAQCARAGRERQRRWDTLILTA